MNQLMVVGPELPATFQDEIVAEQALVAKYIDTGWGDANFFRSSYAAYTHLNVATGGVLAFFEHGVNRQQRKALATLFDKARELDIPTGFLATVPVDLLGATCLAVSDSEPIAGAPGPRLSDWLVHYRHKPLAFSRDREATAAA